MYIRNVLFLLSVVLFSLGAFFTYEGWVFKKLSVSVNGVILEYITEIDEGSRTYRPVVGYITTQGEAIKFSGLAATQFKLYDIGEEVMVRYNITNPDDVKFDTILSMWWKSIFTFIFGILSIIFAFRHPTASFKKKAELDAIDSFIRKSNN